LHTAVTAIVSESNCSSLGQQHIAAQLFIIFINDLDLQIFNAVLKFADDTKVFGSVLNDDGRAVLNNDLHKLS